MTVTTRETARAPGWKQLPWHDWADTIATVHMWTQIVGKVRMALAPPPNHCTCLLYTSPSPRD